MRRKQLPGLDVGGAWTLPVRETITDWELAYIIEMPLETVHSLDEGFSGNAIDIRRVGDLLEDLAGAGFTDHHEAVVFRYLISGWCFVSPNGELKSPGGGRAVGLPERRTMNPSGVVEFDSDRWKTYRKRRLGRAPRTSSIS